MKIPCYSFVAAIVLVLFPDAAIQADSNVFDLTQPTNLLVHCTSKNDGSLGVRKAKNDVERAIAEGRYESEILSCIQFVKGVAAATTYSGNSTFCINSASANDVKAAVVIALKQKYKTSENSVPLIIEALSKNWPCI